MKLPTELLAKADEKLKAYRYAAKCMDCGTVFFDVTLLELKGLFQSGKWDINRPMRWYIKAGRHWVETEHTIQMILTYPDGHEEVYYALSEEWKRQLAYEPDQSKMAMLNELRHLEAQLPPEEA